MSLSKNHELLSEFKRLVQRHRTGVMNLDEQFTQKFEFFVNRSEDIIDEIGTLVPPNKWSYHRIGFLTKGWADYVCGIYKFRAEKNTLIFIPARVITTSNWSMDSKGYLTLFSLDFLLHNHFSPKYLDNKKILRPSEQPYIHLNDEQAEEMKQIFETLLKETEANRILENELIAVKLVELLVFGERFYSSIRDTENKNNSNDLVKKFAELVEQHFTKERSVNFYASQLHTHPNHLNAVMKSSMGMSPKDCILNRLLLEAKYLLHNTDLSVKEIAYQVGFEDPNYFAVVFKRAEKLSPQEYRALFV